MPRALLILLGAGALALLIWLATNGTPATEQAATPTTLTDQTAPQPFALRMSTTLSEVPTRAPRSAAPQATAAPWWQRATNQRTSLLLIASCLLGLALAALWRREAPVAIEIDERVAPEIVPAPDDEPALALRALLDAERSAWSARERELSARTDELQQLVSEGTHSLTDTQSEREQLTTQLAAAQTELADATSRLAQLEDDLAHSRDEKLEESDTLRESREQVRVLEERAAKQLEQIENGTQDNAQLAQRLEQADRRIVELTGELDAAQTRHTEALRIGDDLRAQQQSLIERHEERERVSRERIDELEVESATFSELIEESSNALDVATTQATAMAARLATRENDLHALQTHTDTMQEELGLRMDELVNLRVKTDELNTDREVAQGVTFDLERAMLDADEREQAVREALRNEQDAWRQLNDDAEALRRDLEQAHAQRDELQLQQDALREHSGETEAWLERTKAELQNERSQVAQLREDLAELDESRERLAQWQSSVDTLRNDLRDKDHRVDELNALTEQQSGDIADLTETASVVESLQQKLTEQTLLAKVLKDGADAMRHYKARADERQHTIDNLTNELKDEREAVANLNTSLGEQIEATHASELSLATATEQVAELHEEIDAHLAHIDQLNGQLTERIELLAERDTELATYRDDLRTARATHGQLLDDAAAFDAIAREVDALLQAPLDDIAPATEFDIPATQRAHGDVVDRLKQGLDHYTRIEAELDETRTQLGSARDELSALTQTVDELQPQLDDTSNELTQARETAAALQQQVDRQEEALLDARATQERADQLQARLDEAATAEHDVLQRIETMSAAQTALDAQYDTLIGDHEQLVQAHRALTAAAQWDQEALATLREELVTTLAERDALSQQVDTNASDLAQRDREIEALSTRERDALAELTRLQSAHADLTAELNDARERDDNNTSQQQMLTQEQVTLHDKLEQAETSCQALATELDNLRARDEQQREAQAALQERLASFEKTVQDKNFEVEALVERRDLLESELRDVLQREETQSEQLQAARQVQSTEMSDQLVARDQTLADLVDAVASVSGTDTNTNNAAQRVHDLASGLRHKDGRIDELSHANLALRDALRDVRAEADGQAQRLRAQLERAERTSQDLTVELEKLHREQQPARARVEQLETHFAQSQARVKLLEQALAKYQARLEKLAPPTSKPVDVPVLKRSVGAPPVLTAAVVRDKKDK